MSIVTPKPQTTRSRILGIRTTDRGQILFLDSPGLHRAKGRGLNAALVQAAQGAMEEADLFLYIVEPSEHPEPEDMQNWAYLKERKKPLWLVINKIDRVGQNSIAHLLDTYFQACGPDEIFAISVLKSKGVEQLADEILKRLPEGHPLYDADEVTDQTERQLVAEMIREQAIEALKQELPYSLAVTIETFKDEDKITKVDATLHIERESQKGIVIGAGGEMLKKIGTAARLEIEKNLGRHFFLKLFVRVTDNWTEDPNRVKALV